VRRAVFLIVAVCMIPAAPALGGGWREVGMGAFYGTTLGVLGGGTGLIFTPDPDREYPTYLWIGASAGLVAGVVYGLFLPEEKAFAANPFSKGASVRPGALALDAAGRRVILHPPAPFPLPAMDPRRGELAVGIRLLMLEF